MSIQSLKNANWLIFEKIFTMSVNLFVSIILARSLGTSKFGEISYLLSLLTLFSPLFSMGLMGIVTREVFLYKESEDKVIISAIFIRIIGCCFFSILILISLFFITKSFTYRDLFIVLLIGNLFSVFNVCEYWFEAKIKSKYVSFIRMLTTTIFSILKITAVFYFSNNIIYLIGAYSLEFVFLNLSVLYLYLKISLNSLFKKIDLHYSFNLFKESFWLILSGIASVIYLKIDQVMLAEMTSMSEVGIYAVAVRMSEVWYFFPSAIVASFFASIMEAKLISYDKYVYKLQNLCNFLFCLALFIATCVTFIADFVIDILYGANYSDSSNILVIHIWASLFIFMRELLTKWLIAERLMKFSLLNNLTGAILNVVLNFYLIPLYGAIGAAYATLISYAFASYFILFAHKESRKMAYIMSKSIISPIYIPISFLITKYRR